MKNKFFKSFFTFILIACMCAPFVGCGADKASDDDNTLEVYVWEAGYGITWLEPLLKDFGTLQYVKDKYPSYGYYINHNTEDTYSEQILSNPKINTVDLILGLNMESHFGTNLVADLTDSVYGATVLGDEESVLLKDKMHPTVLVSNQTEDDDGNIHYYSAPWAGGMGGLIYNVSKFEALGLEVPNTTDELFAICDTVKNLNGANPNYPHTYTLTTTKVSYMNYLFNTWWGQYEGIDGYSDFYSGIDSQGNRESVAIFDQKGLEEAVRMMEGFYKPSHGYFNVTARNHDFMAGQTRFIIGEGLIYASGDRFSCEMSELMRDYEANGYYDTFSLMKTPIVSNIREKLPTVNDDATLSAIIDEIDAGKTGTDIAGVSQEDFDTVRAARGIVYSIGSRHTSVIPEYASAKGLAADFLRYMASDRAMAIYSENTYGASLPYKFDFQQKAPEIYNKLNTDFARVFSVCKSSQEILNKPYATVLPYSNRFEYANYGLRPVIADYSNYENIFINGAGGKSGEELTTEFIMQENKKYWSENNNKRWLQLLEKVR